MTSTPRRRLYFKLPNSTNQWDWFEYVDEMNETSPSASSGPSVYLVVLPIIVLVGLGGNVISLVTIFHSRLRHISANSYLIVLTVADSFFLIGVFCICLKMDFVSWAWCVSIEYILMVSSYVSAWATAALTIERYLAIAHPLKQVAFGHIDRWRIMLIWLPVPFILHIFQFVNLVPVNGDKLDVRKCALREADYQIASECIDVLLCFVIPCTVVVICNLLVMGKVNKTRENFQSQGTKESRRQGGSGNGGLTRILWVVPMVFVILNTPFYCSRIYEVFYIYIFKGAPELMYSDFGKTMYNFSYYLYYLNFASDVLVYAFSSANFRKTVVIAWAGICCRRYKRTTTTKITSRSCLDTSSTTQRLMTRTRSHKELGSELERILPSQCLDSVVHVPITNESASTSF